LQLPDQTFVNAIDKSLAERGPVTPVRPRRPRELQDWLNYYLYHPLAWQLARALARTPLTPNAVSVIGAFCVIGAGVAYAQPWYPLSALLGLFLHMSWHVVDGADGDLARMTGRSSPVGEMVDGLCDYISHIILYFVLGWVLWRSGASFSFAWWLMWAAGLSHFVQANHVEVQRRQYQWWVYGTPWIRHSHGDREAATRKSVFGGIVTFYLALAAGMTPYARRIDEAVEQAGPAERERIRGLARTAEAPLLPLLKLLGPNPRAIVLGLSMLAGSPLWYFLYQALFLNLLLAVSVALHNRMARRMSQALSD
jgi:phosphatidylglycerophosphate synthase